MSQVPNIIFNINHNNIERLCCSICKGYLSCAPIRLLPDGSNICGRCSPFINDATYRQVTLEAILCDATFPCPFTKHGCTARLVFGNTVDHEAKCEHRPITCTSIPCTWEGSAMGLHGHFAKRHPNNLKQDACIMIEVNKNKEEILMVVKNGLAFIIKYLYDGKKNTLRYNIRYFANVKEEFCKIKLVNYSEPDYIIQCKGSKCIPYNQDFHNLTAVLDINSYYKNLNEPRNITVTFNLDSLVSASRIVVNYDTLEANKCKKCQYYLIPPIYDNNEDVICSDCSSTCDGCKPSKDKHLNNLLAMQNYPCRWRGCAFTGRADAIRPHELQCEFRTYRCTISECKATFTRTTLVQHLQNHKYLYFVGEIEYKINFENSPDINHLFTIIDNEIVTLEYGTYSYHYLLLQVCNHPDQFAATVYFEHSHCKCKSKKFSLGNNELRVYQYYLPSCFRPEDELTVILTIE